MSPLHLSMCDYTPNVPSPFHDSQWTVIEFHNYFVITLIFLVQTRFRPVRSTHNNNDVIQINLLSFNWTKTKKIVFKILHIWRKKTTTRKVMAPPKRKISKQSSGGSDDEDYRKKRERNNQVNFVIYIFRWLNWWFHLFLIFSYVFSGRKKEQSEIKAKSKYYKGTCWCTKKGQREETRTNNAKAKEFGNSKKFISGNGKS